MQNLLILLPLAVFWVLFLVLKNDFSLRGAFVGASTLLALWIWGSTELLSFFNWLTFEGVLSAWVVALGALLFYIFIKKTPISFSFLPPPKIPLGVFYTVLLGIFLLFLFAIAILQAPNNWDSMTYHLPKVLHWIAHKNVDHYATHIGRQVALNPMAEYFILHTFLLTANDYFANTVQCWAMVGVVVLSSLIAQHLGASFRGQLLAGFLTLSVPIAVLEATSTQNDLVLTYFVLASIWAFGKLKEEQKYHWTCLAGIAMGLAILTKNIAYFYLAPWVLLQVYEVLKSRFAYFRLNFLIAFITILIVLPFSIRNITLFNTPVPEPDVIAHIKHSVSTEAYDLKSFVSKSIRTFGFNLTSPFDWHNDILVKNIEGSHRLLGLDINDKRTSFSSFEMPFHNKFYSQDYAPNPLHTWLFFLLFPLLYIFRERFSKQYFLSLLLGVAGFFLMIFLLKWQPFGTRFQIPFFALVSVWVALAADKLFFYKSSKTSNAIYFVLISSLLWMAGYYVYYSPNLALRGDKTIFNTPREELYFITRPELYPVYCKLVEEVKKSNCTKLHLKLKPDDWEYPLWRMLANRAIDAEIFHHQVDNLTHPLENKHFEACGLVEINNPKNSATFKRY